MTAWTVALLALMYVGGLFLIANWGERHADDRLIRKYGGLIYSLALAVYCTSWTYYGAVGTAVTLTIKTIATDPAADTTYDATNTDGVGADPKATPKMVTTLYTISPNTSEGLASAPAILSSATVSNTTA